jgi:hypothetical protein
VECIHSWLVSVSARGLSNITCPLCRERPSFRGERTPSTSAIRCANIDANEGNDDTREHNGEVASASGALYTSLTSTDDSDAGGVVTPQLRSPGRIVPQAHPPDGSLLAPSAEEP